MPTPSPPHLVALALLCLLVILPGRQAAAENRGVLRLGVAAVELVPTAATPVLGPELGRAVAAYNLAAAAYNESHGYAAGSPMATRAIDQRAVGVRTTLLTLAPALEVGGRHAFVRMEAALGLGEDYRTYGVGVYPLNLALPLRRGAVVPYLSAGGAASWLDRVGVAGELGAIVTARAALGVRAGRRVALEVGYAAFVLGGFVHRAGLETMSDYDPRGAAPPPTPAAAIAGGEQRGAVDVSVGVAL